MTDHELLLAISDMMDKKVLPLKEDIQQLREEGRNEFHLVRGEIQAVREEFLDEIQAVREEFLDGIQAVREELHGEIQAVKEELRQELGGEIRSLRSELQIVKKDVRLIQLRLENDICPRLQNIEECYLSTFERYKREAAQVEHLQCDMVIVKDVLREHSMELEKIS